MFVRIIDQKPNGLVRGLRVQYLDKLNSPNPSGFMEIFFSKSPLVIGNDYSFKPKDRNIDGYFSRGEFDDK